MWCTKKPGQTTYYHPANIFLLLILALLLWRISLMTIIAFTDNTESRYAEIAQLTLNHGFWLMPHIYLDQAFFAKPPLSTWLAAFSAKLLGNSELSLRLPSFLAGLVTLGAIWQWGKGLSHTARYFALFAALTSPLFFVSIGAVMTDAIQMACVTLALLCVHQVLNATPKVPFISAHAASRDKELSQPLNYQQHTNPHLWRLGFWLACGIGMLSKGLATIALIGLPLVLFAVSSKNYQRLWRALWCWHGLLLAALVAVPWYGMAEFAYPGFLNYFFIGEHWMRFTHPGWSGDQYGHAHRYPLGMIWVFWAIAILPWLWVFTRLAWHTLRPKIWASLHETQRLLWCACLAPLLFFTFSSNIILTYPLTAIPPFAVLLAYWYAQNCMHPSRWVILSSVITGMVIIIGSLTLPQALETHSTRQLIRTFHTYARPQQPLIYSFPPPYSAYFYSQENIQLADRPDSLQQALAVPGNLIVVASEKNLPPSIVYQKLYENGKSSLIQIKP